jgi:hypothetical protein
MFRLHLRGFASLLLSVSFLVVVASGLVLWLGHSPQTFGIGKGVWKHAHIFVSLLLLIAGILHWCLNWPAYWGYFWKRAAGGLNLKAELALAVAITTLVASTAFFDDHGADVQRLGAMSLQEVAKKSGKDVDQVISLLEKQGIHVHDPAESLLKIAQHNNVPPQALFAAVPPLSPGEPIPK